MLRNVKLNDEITFHFIIYIYKNYTVAYWIYSYNLEGKIWVIVAKMN